jgi:hypothetical protein
VGAAEMFEAISPEVNVRNAWSGQGKCARLAFTARHLNWCHRVFDCVLPLVDWALRKGTYA